MIEPEFHDLFAAEVHNTSLPPVLKLQFLRAACVGRGASVLGTWCLTVENYAPAWKRLCDVYGDQHRIIQAYVGTIFDIKPVIKENHDGLRDIIDTVVGTLRQLQAMDVAIESWDPLIIHIILARLPAQTIAGWELTREASDVPTLDQLITYLEMKARGRINVGIDLGLNKRNERGEPSTSTGGHSSSVRRDQRTHHQPHQKRQHDGRQDRRVGNETRELPPCPVCQGSHAIFHYKNFAALDVNTRVGKLREWKRCLNCFSLRHATFDCSRPGKKHNSLVCFRTHARKRPAEARANMVSAKKYKTEIRETKKED